MPNGTCFVPSTSMRRFPTRLADLVWPPTCQLCRKALTGSGYDVFCFACWRSCLERSAGLRCSRCGLSRPRGSSTKVCRECRRRRRIWRHARHGARYEGPIKQSIHRFKYAGRASLARPLARLVLRAARDLPVSIATIGGVVPVPMDRWRRIRRGYNPAALIATRLARSLDLPLLDGLLRAKRGPRQAGLSRLERLKNARRRFLVGAQLPPPALILVDDVWTTGATSNICSKLLLERGAQAVYLLTAARRV